MTENAGLGGAFWGRALVSVEWRKLCYVSYAVDPALIAAHLPPGVSLDTLDGRAIVSLVAWSANYPQVFGVPLPGALKSTEMALRYFVREGPRRGAVTLFEDSSSPFAMLAARALFREPTRHAPMTSRVEESAGELGCHYTIERAGSHALSVRARAEARPLDRHSTAYLVVQRPYGYASSSRGELLRYDLDHPVWDTYDVLDHDVRVDYGSLYGDSWSFLSALQPTSVVLAEGSTVRASLPE
jgi:uncharacterized protein